MSNGKQGLGPPPSAGVLGKRVLQHARDTQTAERRWRVWVAYMMLSGLLERAQASGRGAAFSVKGGVSLELRLSNKARATKDIDIILHHDDILSAFDSAITEPAPAGGATTAVVATYEGFAFQRKGTVIDLGHDAMRFELGVAYKGTAWTTISVDLAQPELGDVAPEPVKAIDLGAVGLTGPSEIPCLPLAHQIAQKLHGMTKPMPEGRRNERVKDLVDVVLLEPYVEDLPVLRAACVAVFEGRGTHTWPPTLVPPDEWRVEFAVLATDMEMGIADIDIAIGAVRAFLDRIERAASSIGATADTRVTRNARLTNEIAPRRGPPV